MFVNLSEWSKMLFPTLKRSNIKSNTTESKYIGTKLLKESIYLQDYSKVHSEICQFYTNQYQET